MYKESHSTDRRTLSKGIEINVRAHSNGNPPLKRINGISFLFFKTSCLRNMSICSRFLFMISLLPVSDMFYLIDLLCALSFLGLGLFSKGFSYFRAILLGQIN